MNTEEKTLRRKIEEADRLYYVEDSPCMTDEEYDKLRKQYEEKYGILDYVPGDTRDFFKKITHPVPLLSLDKIFDDAEDTEIRIKAVFRKFKDICLEPKIDGLTVAAYPKADGSCFFATRGKGGITGEVIPVFMTKYSGTGMIDGRFPVRGEVFLTKTDFDTIVKLQLEAGEEPFSNPRNAAAGILRNKEISPYLNYLSYVVYEIPGSKLPVKEQLQLLKDHTKFPVVNHVVHKKLETLLPTIRKIYDDLKAGDIPVDGVVLKPFLMEDTLTKFGSTQHHPNNAIAWKAAVDSYITGIRSVSWQVGRDKITPVANLDPVEIDGTTVSRATLHNLGFFKKLALRRGDKLFICKSGEVIPKVLSVAERKEGFPLAMPVACPSCGGELEIYTNGDISELRCKNSHCSDRVVQNIEFLASKEVLNIRGLSENTARKIVQMYGTDAGEQIIFDLTLKDIRQLPGFAQKNAQNLYNAILGALQKPVSIPTVIKACCFSGIGNSVGVALAERFRDINTVKKALDNYDLIKGLDGIGEKTAAILTSQQFKKKLDTVIELLTIEEPKVQSGPLAGTVWVITGKFALTRTKLETLIQTNGGEVTNSVSRKVDYLLASTVVGSSAKFKKAQELGTKIVTFDWLNKMIQNQK